MILRYLSSKSTPIAFLTCYFLLSTLFNALSVNAGFAFLPNQSDCKLECLNGGVCSFDTENSAIHKCICFIGLFEGDQCERKVTTETPSPIETNEGAEEESHAEELDTNVTDEPQQMLEHVEEDEADYQTELSIAEPEPELSDREIVVEGANLQDIGGDFGDSSEEKLSKEKEVEEASTAPMPAQHTIHLVDSSHFTDLPTGHHIKHYARTSAQPADPNNPALSAWEARPKKMRKKPEQQQEQQLQKQSQDDEDVQRTQVTENQRRKKKKPVTKHREEEEEQEESDGWMMTKRGSGPSRSGATSKMGTGAGRGTTPFLRHFFANSLLLLTFGLSLLLTAAATNF